MFKKRRHLFDELFPLLAFSYSSKGFPDLVNIASMSLDKVPCFLFSLYDYYYELEQLNLTDSKDNRIRIWDSGGYEISQMEDISSPIFSTPGRNAWDLDLYVDAANRIPWNQKDILVNFDSFSDREKLPIEIQIEKALATYEKIKGLYQKDILLHVSVEHEPKAIAECLAPYLSDIDIIGFTEKEIAPTWSHGIKFIRDFIATLNGLGIEAPPIHLFGCFDPKSIIYFSFAGVDIFDGLTWLKYFFDGYATQYVREYEFLLSKDVLLQLNNPRPHIIQHNIGEL